MTTDGSVNTRPKREIEIEDNCEIDGENEGEKEVERTSLLLPERLLSPAIVTSALAIHPSSSGNNEVYINY